MRPQSIVQFERLYILSFLLGLVSTWQNWSARAQLLRSSGVSPELVGGISTALGLLIALALLYLVARRASIVAKWIVTVFAAWAAILLLILALGLVRGTGVSLFLAIGIVQNLLYIAAAALLFRADAREWFGETVVPGEADA